MSVVLHSAVVLLIFSPFSLVCSPHGRAQTRHPKWSYGGESDMLMPDTRSAINLVERWWPKGVICYEIEGNFSLYELDIILEALRDGFNGTCIRLRNCRWECGGDYVAIKNDEPNCFTDVGRLGGRQVMNLGEGCVYTGTVIHETMHALGFYHEHANPNRDDYLQIWEENIDPEMMHNFEKDDPEYVTDFGQPYDYCSITHYDERAFGINNSITMTPKCDVTCEMGFVEELSPIDINKLNIMYDCPYPLNEVSAPTGCREIVSTTIQPTTDENDCGASVEDDCPE
ncbi:hypothetical protein PPYR_03763 [Photinus pyralis]|uniref:Metalloendopeptidase n=1 Tax=Photinus pyralis TaxID=7054 RepID=A0A5N4AW82_PHOPY|nr:astacin-like metalloprotease toxin 5 [Photinus pyralis]KAB0801577.1 hypothetical protein PPYR_03763 [Photinus pyralis]